MFKQAPESQKTDGEKVESPTSNNSLANDFQNQVNLDSEVSAVNPLIFSAISSSNTSTQSLKDQEVKAFLKLVAEGEQDQAEELLKKNPDLALVSSDITDLSGRTFKNITGFQYAVWALDWHMWTMIRKYLPDDDAREQLRGMKTGSWTEQHGKSASWQNLLDALQKYDDFRGAWDERAVHLNQVGVAQRLLPAHVVNEYCHPSRSFHPCLLMW